MKEEIKDKWIGALKSGKYRQGYRALRGEEDKFCCLGVLCDISGEGKWFSSHQGWFTYECSSTDRNTTGLPQKVREWSGISHPSCLLSGNRWLADMNDSGTPFSEIVKVIEEEWESM